jgi:hypothetical protein
MIAFVLLCALSEPGLPMTTVAQGTMSSIDQPLQVVIRSQAEWEALWKRHGASQPAPTVDFRRAMVVGVFLGSRNTAGYKVDIVEIRKTPDGLVVEYREVQPPPDRMVAQIVTAPFHLVSCDRQDGAVRFVASAR